MRYLWGQGRDVNGNGAAVAREGVRSFGFVGGVDADWSGSGGVEVLDGAARTVVADGRGEVDVVALLTWVLIREGTSAGVTLSMIVKDGRRRTEVGSEAELCSLGTGMLEAESMSFCLHISFSTGFEAASLDHDADSVCELDSKFPHSFHDAAFLVRNVPYPVRFTRRYQQMRGPAIDMPI